ncbi:MAG: hypothetical protein RLZ51_2207 [Pseudomonadota bacterium]
MNETITLSEEGGVRYLHFGTPWVQGAMRLSRPFDLELEYVRDMMAWLLFLHAPPRLLQLGLGAGSLAKWCWKHLPDTQITCVERSPQVLAACQQYFRLPSEDERLRVDIADAARALRNPAWAGRFGVIQIDLYDAQAEGPVLDSLAFYRSARAALAEPGVLVVNLFGRGHTSGARSIERLQSVFEGRLLILPSTAAGNRIVLAFRGPPMRLKDSTAADRDRGLQARAAWIDRRFRLGANRWLRAGLPLE